MGICTHCKEPSGVLQCGHPIHVACLNRWMRVSGKAKAFACPYKCCPITLEERESQLLSLASQSDAGSQSAYVAPVVVDMDESDSD